VEVDLHFTILDLGTECGMTGHLHAATALTQIPSIHCVGSCVGRRSYVEGENLAPARNRTPAIQSVVRSYAD
jgi:hypothetical protein